MVEIRCIQIAHDEIGATRPHQGQVSKESGTHMAVFAVTERGDKSYWTKIGVAFVNRDKSITVQLEAFPVSGKLQIRRDEKSKHG